MPLTSQQLIQMLENDGWQKTEKILDEVGIEGPYKPDDIVACAKHCWGVPDRLIKYRPELIKQFTGQHIVDIAGAGVSGLAVLGVIFNAKAEGLHEFELSSDQMDALINNIRTVPQGTTLEDSSGQAIIHKLMGKIKGHEDRKAAFLEEVNNAVERKGAKSEAVFARIFGQPRKEGYGHRHDEKNHVNYGRK